MVYYIRLNKLITDMKQKNRLMQVSRLLVFSMLFSLVFVSAGPASAASVTSLSDNLSTLTASTAANHTITFTTPTGVTAGQDITLTFGAAFTGVGSIVHGDIDVTDDGGELALGSTPSGATWGAAGSGQVVTITSGTGTIAGGSVIVVEIGTHATNQSTGVNQITNGSAGATTATVAIAGSFGDTGTLFVPIITNDTVSISATVAPTISFAVSDNSIGFGTLSTSAARWATGDTNGTGSDTTAHNLTASTNATSGYAVYVRGATLTSGGNTIDAIGGSATGSSVGSEQFGLKVGASGGSGAAVAPYATADYAYAANASTQDIVAESTVASATTTFSINYIANIAATTQAGSYTTNLVYTAAGTF